MIVLLFQNIFYKQMSSFCVDYLLLVSVYSICVIQSTTLPLHNLYLFTYNYLLLGLQVELESKKSYLYLHRWVSTLR